MALFRVRHLRPSRADLAAFVHAIVIRWRYAASDERAPHRLGPGFPDNTVNQAQLQFEGALDPLSCENDDAELMCVTTGMGQKEWVYYARDRDGFMARLNALLAGHAPFPVEINFYDDAEWNIWGGILKRIVPGVKMDL